MPRKIATKSMLAAAMLGAIAPSASAAVAHRARRVDARRPASAASASGGTAAEDGESRHRRSRRGRVSLNGTSLATWFGPGFFGHHTACGQVLSTKIIGVANRTLPCGTLIKVSYQGRHIVVPVIDRGPYGLLHANWDLTQQAARQLHISETVRVRTRIVGKATNTPTLGSPPEPAPATPVATETAGATGGISA